MKKSHLSLLVFACVAMLSLCAQEKKAESPWKAADKLFPGIKLIKLDKTEPRLMKIHIVRIDLQDGKYKLFTTPKPDEWGQNMPEENAKDLKIVTRRQSAKAFMKQAHQPKKEGGYGVEDMLVAVNASPWTPWKAPWNHKFACHMGLTVAQGDILDTNDLGRPSFIVYKNGAVDFRNRIGVEESDSIGSRIDEGVVDGLSGVFGFVKILELLRVQLGDGERVGFEEEGSAARVGGKAHGRVPLTKVLHKLPTPGRQGVGRLAGG